MIPDEQKFVNVFTDASFHPVQGDKDEKPATVFWVSFEKLPSSDECDV